MTKIKKFKFISSVTAENQFPAKRLEEIIFSGKSNVGKSSLINKLLNYKKAAYVSSVPGKTQSINYFLINDKFYFVDLPGYGYAKVSKQKKKSWKKLLDTYLNEPLYKSLIIQLVDFRHPPSSDDMMMIDWLKNSNINFVIVATKTDKISPNRRKKQLMDLQKKIGLPKEQIILFSIKEKIGNKELLKFIFDSII